MSWREREGLRREVFRYGHPDRPYVELDRPRPGREAENPATGSRITEEWSERREAVQMSALYVEQALSWPFSPSGIDEPSAGTYYTDWIDLNNGPYARGLFSCPELSVALDDAADASVYLEVQDSDGVTTSVLIASLSSSGLSVRAGAGLVLVSLFSGMLLVKARYKVTSSGAVVLTPSAGSLVYYGGW